MNSFVCRGNQWGQGCPLAGFSILLALLLLSACTARPRGADILATRTTQAHLANVPTATAAYPTVIPHTPAPHTPTITPTLTPSPTFDPLLLEPYPTPTPMLTAALTMTLTAPTPAPPLPQQTINESSLRALQPVRRIGYGRAIHAAFAPGDRLLAVATTAGIVWYELPTLRHMRFDPMLGSVDSITFSPSGKFMAVAQGRATGSPTTLFLHSRDGAYIATLQGADPLFSPGERLIATTHYSGTASQETTLLWSSTDGTQRAALVGSAPRFSPNGLFIATVQNASSSYPSTLLWHSETGTLLRDLRGRAPAFSPDGQWLALATGSEVHLWSLAGSKLATSHLVVAKDIQTESIAFSPDGQQVRMAASDGLHVWNVLNDSLFSNLAVGGTLDPSGKLLVNMLSHEGGTMRGVQLTDPANGKVLYEDREFVFAGSGFAGRGGAAALRTIGFNSSVTSATLVRRDGLVRLVDLRSGATRELALPGIQHMAFSPDGQTLAIARPGPQLELWNVAENAAWQSLETSFGPHRRPRTIHFGPGGHQLFVEEEIVRDDSVGELVVSMWQVPTDTVGSEVWQTGFAPTADSPDPSAQRPWDFSPVISTTTWVNQEGQAQLAAVSGISLTLTEPGAFTAVDFSPDGTLLAVADQYGTMQLLKTEGGYLFDTLQGEGAIHAVRFSPDGTLLGALHADGTLLVWRVGEQTPMSSMAAHPDDRFTFSPDSQVIIAGGPQGMAFYRASDGVVLERLNVSAQQLAFSVDQRLLATLSGERVVVWGVR